MISTRAGGNSTQQTYERETSAATVTLGTPATPARERDLLDILFDRVPVGIAVYDRSYALKSFNRTWADHVERYALCERHKIVPGAYLHELAPGIERETAPLLERALSGETVRVEGLRLECRGAVSYWDVVLYPLYENGRIGNIVEVVTDATDRVLAHLMLEKRVEERTRELERRQAVAESLGEALALLNSSQSLHEILQRLAAQSRELLGADCSAIFDLNTESDQLTVQAFDGAPSALLAGYVLPVGVGAVGEAVAMREPVLIADTRAALPRLLATLSARASGEEEARLRGAIQRLVRHYRATLAVPLVVRGEIYGGIALYYEQRRDFTPEDLKLTDTFAHQAALAIDNARLRHQMEAAAVAAERNRIARDLHDSVTQTLFSASLIGEVLPRLWEIDQDEARKRVEELRQLTRGALAEMRMLLLELRPAQINQVPLGDLLKHLVEATTGRARISIALMVQGECPLPECVHNSLYRIAQEALNNVAKHSGATQAAVALRWAGGGVELGITDNGRGFDPGSVAGEHLGLSIMSERAQEIGANWNIDSRPGGGANVTVRWDAPAQIEGTTNNGEG
jgi:signal transduction histidine kinase